MVFDKDDYIRNEGINLINSSKQEEHIVRKFKVPTINFKAKKYYEMVNLKKSVIATPPLLKNLNIEQVKDLRDSNEGDFIKKIPCLSQAVERFVKVVTEASKNVSKNQRHGYILNKIKSRQIMPKFETKKDFNFY